MGRRTISDWIIQGLHVYFKIASSPRREWRYNQEKTLMNEREITTLDARSWSEICSSHSSWWQPGCVPEIRNVLLGR
jgi:hypothetical protein